MKLLPLVALSLLSHFACAQRVKAVSIPTYGARADTSLSFKIDRATGQKIHLQNLQAAAVTSYFRIWLGRLALDIWTLDNKQYAGAVTSYAQHYNEKLVRKGLYRVDTILFMRTCLPVSDAQQIAQLIDSLSITRIPSDNQIAGWRAGLDGVEYRIETSSPDSYTYKTYWTPRIFADTLWEARQIQTLVDKLYGNFKLADYTRQLKLLPGHYQHDGIEGVQIAPFSPAENPVRKTSLFDWF